MLQKLSLRYKIAFIAMIGFFGFFIYQAANYRLSLQVSDKLQQIVSDELPVLQFANRIQVNFSELNKFYQASLAEADVDTLAEAEQKALAMRREFEVIKQSYQLESKLFDELYSSFIAYTDETSAHTRRVLQDKLKYDEILEGYTTINHLREYYLEQQKHFINDRYRLFENKLYQIEEEERFLVRFGLMLGIVLTILLGFVSIVIIRRIIDTFNEAVHVAEDIASGKLDEEVAITSGDETGKLLLSLNTMRLALKEQQEANQRRSQEQSFLSGLNESMRGDKSLEELACVIVAYSLDQLDAQIGALYLVRHKTLVRQAALNYPRASKEHISLDAASIYSDVIASKQPLLSTNLPKHYQQKYSDFHVNSILLLPVVHEGRALALLEVAAKRCLKDQELSLLQRCNNAIAVSIESAKSRFQLAKMLTQTQEQAAELSKKREALALINKQLEDKNHVLDEQKNQILHKNLELERSQQALLEKSEALEVSGKYKSQFLSTMSHELRTPLNSILILSEALKDNKQQTLDEKSVEHARIIHHAGSDLLALINDILDLSKVEEGKMDVVIEPLSLKDLAGNWRYQFALMAEEKDLQFDVNINQNLDDEFFCDRQRLNQIIRNFISNALKFTDQGSVQVCIDPPSPKDLAPEQNAEDYLLFSVVDTGVGIEKDKQELVFEAFKQADGTTSRKYGGTGLGLTISKELAHLLGGEISLHSEGLGHGTRFSLLLPKLQASGIDSPTETSQVLEQEPAEQLAVFNDVVIPSRQLQEAIWLFDPEHKLSKLFEKLSKRFASYLCVYNDGAALQKALDVSQPLAIFVGEQQQPWLQGLLANRVLPLYSIGATAKATATSPLLYAVKANKTAVVKAFAQVVNGQALGSERVLFIEDNPVFHQVIHSLFNKQSQAVVIAENGKDALTKLLHQLFDYIVIDLNLPDYQGDVLVQAIRSLPAYQQKKLLIFTAEDLMQHEKAQLLRYADEVVFKTPQSIAYLRDQALAFIANKKAPSTAIDDAPAKVHIEYQDGMLHGKKVLLVDDDERNLYSLSTMLETEGLEVVQASSGKQALALLAKDSGIALLLLDIMMPEMDGFEVLTRIRRDPNICEIPVIALTAKAMVGDKQACLDAGANDYLAKPVDMKALLNMLAMYLSVANASDKNV